MNILNVRKKQMRGAKAPQLYTCTVEFTEEELEALTDNMVVEVKPGALEDLTSFAISKWSKELTTFKALSPPPKPVATGFGTHISTFAT